MIYTHAVLIDYDGQETRHEFRKLLDAQHAFTQYLVNAASNNSVFSVTLVNQLTGERISHWER